mmetsp:Transcript_4505/g.8157  ORF Transcript_4505/g.8157 Transcript_4505/m.8157 type:complete len:111 (-) Transcript_4505:167-499(-)
MKAKSQGGKKEEVVVDETIDYEIDENNQSTGVVNECVDSDFVLCDAIVPCSVRFLQMGSTSACVLSRLPITKMCHLRRILKFSGNHEPIECFLGGYQHEATNYWRFAITT